MTQPALDEPGRLVADLVRVDSSNPGLAGGPGEAAVADLAQRWLAEAGFEVRRLEATPGRPSLVAVGHGRGGGRSLMLNGHLDTASLTSFDGDPLDPEIRDGCLYARGAYDMKAGLAAMMTAAARVHARPHAGDVVLALVADEEYASAGTEEVLRHVTADAAVVCEPTGLDVVVAHRGFCWAEVTIVGRAAHGSRPDLGLDAIVKAGAFLAGLDELADRLAQGTSHPLLGTGNVHAGTIAGGQEGSSYPERCTVVVERRTLPGEDATTLDRELRRLLDPLVQRTPGLAYELVLGLGRRPFEVGFDEPVVQAVRTAAAEVLGHPPVVRGEPFWTDAALLSEAGIPSVLFGPDGGGAHAAVEWVDLASLTRTTTALEKVVAQLTGPSED